MKVRLPLGSQFIYPVAENYTRLAFAGRSPFCSHVVHGLNQAVKNEYLWPIIWNFFQTIWPIEVTVEDKLCLKAYCFTGNNRVNLIFSKNLLTTSSHLAQVKGWSTIINFDQMHFNNFHEQFISKLSTVLQELDMVSLRRTSTIVTALDAQQCILWSRVPLKLTHSTIPNYWITYKGWHTCDFMTFTHRQVINLSKGHKRTCHNETD